VLIGFLFAYALVAAGRGDRAAYVDPGMVTLVSLAFLWVPIKLIVSSLREVLSMAPEADVLDQLRACAVAAEERYALSESLFRA
jgi:predicted Co/Zn/Cd cation transporter (cation efflux family)